MAIERRFRGDAAIPEVEYRPETTGGLFDDVVGPAEQNGRKSQAKRLCG
jgi:hypothetical protein